MERNHRHTLLVALACVLLAANLIVMLRGTPAGAQDGPREEKKQYKVAPTNMGADLEERLNAMAAKGWHLKEVITTNGTSTNWIVYEK
jgi:hypothetical protein